MRLEVAVTKQNIEDGEGNSGEYDKCPVARALRELGCKNIDADEERILLTFEGKRYVYQTPREAMLFINDFDSDRIEHLKPFSFELDEPELATPEHERKPFNWRIDGK